MKLENFFSGIEYRYLSPEVKVIDVGIEGGFALSATGEADDEGYQIPGLTGDPDDEGEEY